MLEKLKETFRPVGDIFADIPRTFTPYRYNETEFALRAFNSPGFRDDNLWGDVAQPFRGIVNILKGVERLMLFVLTIPIVTIPLAVLYLYIKSKIVSSDGGDASHNIGLESYNLREEPPEQEFKFGKQAWKLFTQIPYNLVNGIGIALRGALQFVTTPLTWFIRIPLRRAITAGLNNPQYTRDYNKMSSIREEAAHYAVKDLPPLRRILADFKGTLAAYDRDELFWNVLVDFAQPLRGLWNIGKGVVLAPLAILRFVFGTMLGLEFLVRCKFMGESAAVVFFGNSEKGDDYKNGGIWPMLRDSIGVLGRGILQVLATPFELVIRMPLRGLITYHMGDGRQFIEADAEYYPKRENRETYGAYRENAEPTTGARNNFGFSGGGRGAPVVSQTHEYYDMGGDENDRGRNTEVIIHKDRSRSLTPVYTSDEN